MTHFLLNGRKIATACPPGLSLLDFLRGGMRLTAAKPACREGDCGACTVLLGAWNGEEVVYRSVNACLLPVGEAAGRHVLSLEGLHQAEHSPIQRALLDAGAVQCGYCTPGLVLALTAHLLEAQSLDQAEAEDAVAGNLCRCTGYAGIRRAIGQLCASLDIRPEPPGERLERLIRLGILPAYLRAIPERLRQLPGAPSREAGTRTLRVGGGTDLFVRHAEDLARRELAFLSREASLRGIWTEDGRCFIGAETSMEEIRRSPLLNQHFPSLAEDFRLFAAAPVRHRATLGGNLANASPIADGAVYFLAHGATLGIKTGRQLRELALEQFFLDYKHINLGADEEIAWLSLELPAKPTAFSFEKVSRRGFLDIASVNSALRIETEDGQILSARLSAGGIAPIPLLLAEAGEFLAGRPLCANTVKEAARLAVAAATPIDDIRGSAPYKRLLLRQIVYAHFLKLFPDQILWEDLR